MTVAMLPVSHIVLDQQGRPWIEGTTMKVSELIAGKVAYGWNADEMARQYPHLSMAQIHAALAYYYDNEAALRAELGRIANEAAIERERTANSPLRKRLRALGKIA